MFGYFALCIKGLRCLMQHFYCSRAQPHVDLSDYNKSARKRHIKIIREYLQINPSEKLRRQAMKSSALNAATTKENLADIINCIIDELIKDKFELPAFQNLVRLSRAARTVINNDNYTKIFNALSEEQKKTLDLITGIETSDSSDDKVLSWSSLKLEPKKPTPNNIKEFVQYVNNMKALYQKININLDFIAPARIEQLRDEAMIANTGYMREMRPIKRYALATILRSGRNSCVKVSHLLKTTTPQALF
jgi:hypothetical protein